MDPLLRVTSLSFTGGDVIDTSEADVVVFVGPNNAGKSRALADLQQLAGARAMGATGTFALTDVQMSLLGKTPEEAIDWLLSRGRKWRYPPMGSGHSERTLQTPGKGGISESTLHYNWREAERQGLRDLTHHVLHHFSCDTRLQLLNWPQRLDIGAPADSPIQAVFVDPQTKDRFSKSFRNAFGLNAIFDGFGLQYRVRASAFEEQRRFEHTTSDGAPDAELMEAMASIPSLETQSDGVKAFSGLLMTLIASRIPILLVDEPEAFLHPPQARRMGRELASPGDETQVFVATHSVDVLIGLLEARPKRVMVVRLTASAGKVRARSLAPGELHETWRDPLLRFSRVLDGLFHDGVVVCEGPTDSAFYDAVAQEHKLSLGKDLLFVHSGSKQRSPSVTRSLRALGVPVACIVDFDALNNATTLEELASSLDRGLDAAQITDRTVVDAGIRGSEPKITKASVVAAIADVLGGMPDDHELTPSERRIAAQAAAGSGAWDGAKAKGLAAVPSGDQTVAAQRLVKSLAQQGLFVVPSGAVESFVRAVGGKSTSWLLAVIAGGHLRDAEHARRFVSDVLSSLSPPANPTFQRR